MIVVFDTDIISCIAKTENIELIENIFPGFRFSISPRVYDEIREAKDIGYDFVGYIQNLIDTKRIEIISAKNAERMKELEDSGLDFGDIESIAVAEENNAILLSNDKKVKRESKVEVFDIEALILIAIDNHLIQDKEELLSLINDIGSKDNISLRNKQFLISRINR